MDTTTAQKVVFGDAPADIGDALRWLDAALTWYGFSVEGPEDGERTLVTAFHWDTHGVDIRRGRQCLSRRRVAAYDRNTEAAFTLIDQCIGDAYAFAMNLLPCNDCGCLYWYDPEYGGGRDRHLDADDCFLIRCID